MAQCTVSIGPDVHVCGTLETGFPPTTIGEQILISDATEPCSYQWSIEPISFFSSTLYASDFLNDTSIANPTVLDVWEDSLTFYLKVEDALQQVCYDTIIVSASVFSTHLGSVSYTINAGDSVELFFGPNLASNFPTDSLVWRPHIGLTDSTSLTPWVSPPVNVNYYCILWDTQGCMQVGSPFQFVQVNPVGMQDGLNEPGVEILFTQHDVVLTARDGVLPFVFDLWDAHGRSVQSYRVMHPTERISVAGLEAGVYFFNARKGQRHLKGGKLLISQ